MLPPMKKYRKDATDGRLHNLKMFKLANIKITLRIGNEFKIFKNIKKKKIFKLNKFVCTIFEHSPHLINITSIKTKQEIKILQQFFEKLTASSISITIDNIFMHCQTGIKVRMIELYHYLKSTLADKFFIHYNTESFHGLSLKPLVKKTSPTFIIYETGKIICMGKYLSKIIHSTFTFLLQAFLKNKKMDETIFNPPKQNAVKKGRPAKRKLTMPDMPVLDSGSELGRAQMEDLDEEEGTYKRRSFCYERTKPLQAASNSSASNDTILDSNFPPQVEYGLHTSFGAHISIKNRTKFKLQSGESLRIKTNIVLTSEMLDQHYWIKPNCSHQVFVLEGGVKVPTIASKRLYLEVTNFSTEDFVIPEDTCLAYLTTSSWIA